jgi:hypothetical protein
MTVRNTNIKTLNVDRVIRDSIQTGTIPVGVTASDSKYPLNISDVTYGNPNGTPSFYPLYPVDQVSENYTIKVTGDWSNSIKTGDPIMIKRGNMKNLYTVRKTVYDSVTNKDTITLFSSRYCFLFSLLFSRDLLCVSFIFSLFFSLYSKK